MFTDSWVEILAAEQTPGSEGWYQGTADAVRQQLSELIHACTKYVLAGLDWTGLVDDMFKLLNTTGIKTSRQTKVTQRALAACNLYTFRKIRFLLAFRAHKSLYPPSCSQIDNGL